MIPANYTIFGTRYDFIIQNLIGSTFAGTVKYNSVIGAGNGKLYCIPSRANQVLEIDPLTGVTNLIGTSYVFGSDKWSGGVLAPNGNIYCMPLNYNKVMMIDPVAGTTTLIGTDYIATNIIDTPGYAKWNGGALASNGKIYCIPRGHTQMLEIDPSTNTTTLVGSVLALYGEKYSYGAFTNGKIYGMPNTLNNVLVYDVTAGTTSFISTTLAAGSFKCGACTVATNGKIYTAPNTQTKILVVDPVAGTTSTIEASNSGFGSSTIAPNGKIYCIPFISKPFLEIDTALGTSKSIGSNLINVSYFGGTIGKNGKIYGAMYDATRALEIEVLDIDVMGTDRLVPASLTTLAASNYNRYYNNR